MSPRGQGFNTPTRPIRIDLELWERFGVAAEQMGTDRSSYLRDVIRWVLREPGARAPKRPPAEGEAQTLRSVPWRDEEGK